MSELKFGRKEALQFLAELDKKHEQMRRVSAIWAMKYAMENLSHPIENTLLALANSLKASWAQMPTDTVTHKSKQPYCRRHAKGWNK